MAAGVEGDKFLFTSESVGEGHPGALQAWRLNKLIKNKINTKLYFSKWYAHAHTRTDKICDQVSDAILDACLAQDPYSKVACGTFKYTRSSVFV